MCERETDDPESLRSRPHADGLISSIDHLPLRRIGKVGYD